MTDFSDTDDLEPDGRESDPDPQDEPVDRGRNPFVEDDEISGDFQPVEEYPVEADEDEEIE